jgi:molybdate transport system substrate-binding protein
MKDRTGLLQRFWGVRLVGAERKSSRITFTLLTVIALLLSWETPLALGQPITVAAAADLTGALGEIAANYQKATGQEVKLSFGASGNLTSQIRNGAPFDLFFSADEDYPKKLVDAGLADANSIYRYAMGRLVLWVPASSSLDIEHRGLRSLLDPSVTKIAIANPQHAPYGRAAEAALKHEGIYDSVASKLVLGENVSQAAQFVESGNAQVGLVALSHALAPHMKDKGRYWQVPSADYPVLNQAAVLISKSVNKKRAQAFLEFVKSADVVSLLQHYGFSVGSEATQ